MKVSKEELDDRMENFKEVFGREGLKLTHQRLEIFHEVAGAIEHPDAETVYKGVSKRVPTISLDTVYRTLWLLLDLGLISTLGAPRERARFDANLKPHHHFVCTSCGKARDIYSKEFDSLKVPDSVKEVGSVEKTQVEIKGLCSRCSKKKAKARKHRH